MILDLNLTPEDQADEGYKAYSGSLIQQRPLIIAAKRIPMRVAYLMGLRILHPESDWMTHYFDGDDRVAYAPDGDRFKIGSRGVLGSYESHGTLVEGAVEFDVDRYEALPWTELKRSELILEENLSIPEAQAHALWLASSQNNQALLNAYVETLFQLNGSSMMGVCLDAQTSTNAWMRAACVDRLGGRVAVRWQGSSRRRQ